MNIKKGYNEWAKIYDSNVNRTRDLEAVSLRQMLAPYSFHHVLELGCGTGKNTFWLAERAKSLVGLDFSEEMLAKAKSKNHFGHVRLQLADIQEEWEVEDGAFDLISCSLTLEHIDDLEAIFAQASQKIQPGGLFYIGELHPFKQYLGTKARFGEGDARIELDVFVHHISDFLKAAKKENWELLALKEWFDEGENGELPRLVSFVFKKI
ncbi:MAG TPA: class I SAM-dependent methyltransferase [Saprospiraceae bacterium]|nr:class I SAM-dependent methyltransferase [Saprospiraceae bacterium]